MLIKCCPARINAVVCKEHTLTLVRHKIELDHLTLPLEKRKNHVEDGRKISIQSGLGDVQTAVQTDNFGMKRKQLLKVAFSTITNIIKLHVSQTYL